MQNLPISVFALALAAAGIPLYIHLPRFAEVNLGLSLTTVGAILIAIRILDFVQDPALGWMVDRYKSARTTFVRASVIGLALGFVLLFTVPPLFAPWLWLTLSLVVVFTAYSLASILFYGQTRALSGSDGSLAMIQVAKWREAGALIGIILAAALPALLGYPLFGVALFVIILLAGRFSTPIWRRSAPAEQNLSISKLARSGGGPLLALTFVNSLPVAITSTLFVFFVEDRLGLSDAAGPLLILFFLSAAAAIPIWSRVSLHIGARRTLIIAMSLAILSFGWAATLTGGEIWAFAAICIGAGFATGADMLILPALFSSSLARAGLETGQAFGFWAFANKMALAAAAGIVLPLLDAQGFQSAVDNSPEALARLTLLYAIVPCGLKILAILLTFSLPRKAFGA